MKNVFIDGSAGTTGLRIADRLKIRKDINLITLSEERRKDTRARSEALNDSDIAFLCLPDEAALEAVSLIKNEKTRVIDTSTAHRTQKGWTYGFPELKGQKEKILSSKRIANPGCHASGFVALIKPLTDAGILDLDANLSCFSITGYSGGGKKMIAEYEDENRSPLLSAPRQYALTQEHKHLKEMSFVSGIKKSPVFCPVVADFYSGMEVTVSLCKDMYKGDIETLKQIYKEYYSEGSVFFSENPDEKGFLSAKKLSGTDDMEISVLGNNDRTLLVSRFDNLGKGASGSAVQNMNILLGVNETEGLIHGGI